MKSQTKSMFFLFAAPIIWGFAFVMQCVADTTVLGVFSFNAIRYFLGAAALIPVIFFLEGSPESREASGNTVKYGIITGIILFVASWLQMYGISLNKNSGKSGFLTGLYIVIVPFLGSIFLRKKVSFKEWLAAIIAMLGLFLLSVPDGFENIDKGDIMVVIGAFFWAGHILLIDKFVPSVSPIRYSGIQFLTCGVFSLLVSLFTEKLTLIGINANIMPLLYTGIVSTSMGYTFQILGQKDVNPNFASIVLGLEGVFSAIAGAIFLAEKLTPKGYLGCVLMFAGTVLSQIGQEKK